jgi:NAD(P)-dependent dehydrogenase (short-subunit alcohol dehydrogenase family)
MDLINKVAVITGAGSGIGKASALCFAKAGAKVAVLSHTPDEVQTTVKEIQSAGGEALPVVADVGKSADVQRAMNNVATKFGRIDIVFANAGINGVWAPIEELHDDEFDKTITTNLRGTFLTIKYAVPYLKKAGGGSVLVTASINGTRVFSNTGATAYATSKAGQLAMAKMLALELAQFKIRVNVICPGAIETNIEQNTIKRDIEKVKIEAKFSENHPLARAPGTADDVAELALFLASDASRHITGTPVWIDGAESLLRG